MNVREFIDKQKQLLIPAAIIGILVFVVAIWRNSGDQLPGIVNKVYFSDDDGKSYFADDVAKGFSFDHGGKTAYRAFVYRCGSGSPFVGLLARTADSAAAGKELPYEHDTSRNRADPRFKGAAAGPTPPIEVRKPGTSEWVLSTGPKAQEFIKSLCPDGSPDSVQPD